MSSPDPPAKPGPLPAGDYVFMAFLALGPMSAYDVKKAMAGTVSFFWSAAHSQVYQQARRLVRDGLVAEEAGDNARRRRLLTLTPAGRAALESWLHSPEASVRYYDEALAKVFFGDQVGPAALVAMLRGRRTRHADLLAGYQQMEPALRMWDPGGSPPYPLLTLRLGIRLEQGWVEWLDETIATLEGYLDTGGAHRPRKKPGKD
ncbi:MAG TPA: PadR family transcriptional regulator [Actinomycetota bacterium]|nr:PadR family transcriptional regulator [Actinomycetota bacterium]